MTHDQLTTYFTPNKIVPSYCGQDRVISLETGLSGWPSWRVWVEAVDCNGNTIGPKRWHCTLPRILNTSL
jgi:hypothetical protein